MDGACEGRDDGVADGYSEGSKLGLREGDEEGTADGITEGTEDGCPEGKGNTITSRYTLATAILVSRSPAVPSAELLLGARSSPYP